MNRGSIYAHGKLRPRLAESVLLMPGAVVIGDVEIGERSSVWFNAVIRGDINWIRIGEETNVQDGCVLHVTNETAPLRVGRGVTVGHLAMVHGCTVEDHCLIGMQATLLDGAVIGEESLVAAGTTVLEGTIVPPRSFVAGTPGVVKRSLSPGEVEELRGTARLYLEYCAAYRDEGFGV